MESADRGGGVRRRLEQLVEALIEVLDAMDGDPDREPDVDEAEPEWWW